MAGSPLGGHPQPARTGYPRAQPKDCRKFPAYPWQGRGLEVGQGGALYAIDHQGAEGLGFWKFLADLGVAPILRSKSVLKAEPS